MASVFYHQVFADAMQGTRNLLTDVQQMMLLISTTTTPDSPDHVFVSDIDADEATDASYARVLLAGEALTDQDADDRVEWDFLDVVYPTLAGATILMAVGQEQTGGDDLTPTNDPLIALWDIANTAPDGSNFTLQVGTTGAVHFTG